MDKLVTKGVGGLPLLLNDLRQFFGRLASPSHGIYQAFNNILRGFGDNFIVQGCVVGGSPGFRTLTEGWVILDGELIKVDISPIFDESTDNKFVKVTTFDARGNKDFQNGSNADTYEKNRAVIQGTTGNLAFDGDAIGIWQEEAFDASDFTADTGTWTLTDPFTSIRTFLLGKMMTVNIAIIASTIASGPTNFVDIKVPRGKTISKGMTNLGSVTFSGASVVATFLTQILTDTIRIAPIDGTDFPDGSLVVTATITFEID